MFILHARTYKDYIFSIFNQLINLMKSKLTTSLLALSILFISSAFIQAQDTDIVLSHTYYINKVNIIQKPGQMIEMGSIIIKNGVIIEIGKDLVPPPDAIIVKADSMYLYPGFIDAFNTTGIKKVEEDRNAARQGQRGGGGNNPQVPNPGNPPNNLAGITPEKTLSEVFDKDAKSTKSWREIGFTASFSSPEGGMLPGQAALILLNSKDADGSILKQNFGIVGTFENARRMYPATIIGVMAKYRDLFRQSGYSLKHENDYAVNPVGMTRPSYDASIRALYPINSKKLPIYFEAEKIKDVSRALTLQNDLGFNMVLTNVKQGALHADQIKNLAIPVVLSLDIPQSDVKKPEEGDKKSKDDSDAKGKKGEEKSKKEEMKDPEIEAMEARKEESIKEYQSQASIFSSKGISFSFSGKDVKEKDVKKNLKSMMEYGLTEDQVLAALTINPASLLGVSNIMGTLEKGKMANFFISDGPYFEDDSNIKYIFVEGNQFENEVKAKKKKQDGEETTNLNLAGTYSYTVDVPGDERKGKLIIKKNGNTYTGIIQNDGNDESDIDNLEVDGNKISFPLDMNIDGGSLKLSFSFEIDGDDLKGSVSVDQYGTFPIKGEKVSGPNN